MSKIHALILAAGKGTRMPSARPKALQTILGQSMLGYVYQALAENCDQIYTVIGHEAEQIKKYYLKNHGQQAVDNCILQTEQLGTGHAVQCALAVMEKNINLAKNDKILIVNADTPLLTSEIIKNYLDKAENSALSFISLNLEQPLAYGRVMREDFAKNAESFSAKKCSAKKCSMAQDSMTQDKDLIKFNTGKVKKIIEAKDFKLAYPNLEIFEINSGIYLINYEVLSKYLPLLSTKNVSKEYYLTDIIALAKADNLEIDAINFDNNSSLLGVNNPLELHQAEKILQENENIKRMKNGIILHNPDGIFIAPSVQIQAGVEIFGPCEIYGQSLIGENTVIKSHCIIINTEIAENCQINSFSHLENAKLANNVSIGPYARLRPGAELAHNSRIGNFVEIKNTKIGQGSKVNHLSYMGDAVLGENVNVGAGSITCNYDGQKKHQTIIEDNVFLGSNTAYVAPVKIGKNVLVGAGSTITKDIPDNNLAIARQVQKNIEKKK